MTQTMTKEIMSKTYDPDYDWIMSPSDQAFDQHMTDAPAMLHTKTMTITWWRRPDPDDPGASSEAEHWCHRHRQPCHLPLPRPGELRKYIFWQWYTVNCDDDDQMSSMLCSIFQECLSLDDIEYSIHRNASHLMIFNIPSTGMPCTVAFTTGGADWPRLRGRGCHQQYHSTSLQFHTNMALKI